MWRDLGFGGACGGRTDMLRGEVWGMGRVALWHWEDLGSLELPIEVRS